MGSFEIRWATVEDLPALRDVFRRSSWSNEGDRPLLTEHPEFLELADTAVREGRTRVAVDDTGAVVGFSSIVRRGDAFEVEDLFVDPDRMRHGIGLALVDDLVDLARTEGVARLEVDGNDHALAFYARAGFVALGRVALEHGEAIRMVRSVAAEGEPLRGER